MKVSTFSHILPGATQSDAELSAILNRFRTEDKNGISALKILPEDAYKAAKQKLPVVTFGGVFKAKNGEYPRSNANLKESSGLMVLDFDHVNPDFFEKLKADEFIYAAWASPSGQGFKSLVRIPRVKDDAEFKSYYFAIMEHFPDLDTSGQDICRACFFCYDPNLHINPDAKVWVQKAEIKKPEVKKTVSITDYSIVNRCLNIIRYAVEGERNAKIVKAAKLLGGYVAAGKVNEQIAIDLLCSQADETNPGDRSNHAAVKKGLGYGLLQPIHETDKQLQAEESEQKLGKIYFTAHDLNAEIDYLYEHGQQRGAETGLINFDKIYTVKPGSTTYIYGEPYHGKTQFWFDVLIRLSELHGWRHMIFSNETGTATDVFAELIQIKSEGDFFKTYGSQISREKLEEAKKFVDAHFIVIDPSDKIITIADIMAYSDIVEKVHKTKIHTLTIDPWNEVRHDLKAFGNRQDMYLEWMLGSIRDNAKSRDRHTCIITHVQDQKIQKDKGIWHYPPATFRQIAGGQAWSRKGMGCLCVWRPKHGLTDENGRAYQKNETVVLCQKAKPKGVGDIGEANLLYNLNSHRYEDLPFTESFPQLFETKPEPPF